MGSAGHQLLTHALRLALAERLELRLDDLGDIEPEAAALALGRFLESEAGGHFDLSEETRQELLTEGVRGSLAAELEIGPDRLGGISVLGAAHTLDRLRRRRQTLGGDELTPDEIGHLSRESDGEKIARVVREGLAEQLGAPREALADMRSEIASAMLLRLLDMRQRVRLLTTQLEGPAEAPDGGDGQESGERRDAVARIIRNVIAEDIRLHPRLLAGLSPVAAAVLLGRLAESRRQIDAVRAQVAVDELTGALRRPAGENALEREIRRARRLSGGRMVIAFIDVDALKAINDSNGHAAGDELLRALVEALHSRLRAYDLVIRWGGDEFVCVFPETDRQSAASVIDDVLEIFAGQTQGQRFSVGLATLQEGDTVPSLVARADVELYSDKRTRRVELNGSEPPAEASPTVAEGPTAAAEAEAPTPSAEAKTAAEDGDPRGRRVANAVRRLLGG